MKKVFQTIVDQGRGNCVQATVASLFDLELDQVPNFIELGVPEFQVALLQFFYDRGYEVTYSYNSNLRGNTLSEVAKFDGGINGYFYATVPSQTFPGGTHAVVVDSDLMVVHDPNPNQKCLNLKPEDIICIMTYSNFYIDLDGKFVRHN